jgi:hypothetical protein
MARIIYTKGTREQRKDRRALRPTLDIAIGGETYPTANWSLGGLLVQMGAAAAGLGPRSPVTGVMAMDDRPGIEPVAFSASVVRVDPNGLVALVFDRIDEAMFAFFERCLRRP